jgi:hypothetical protein
VGHQKTKFALALTVALMMETGAQACGPIEGTYVSKNRFAPDNTLTVTRDGGSYRYSLDLYYANQKNDGSLTSMGLAEGKLSVSNCKASGYDEDNECHFNFSFKADKATVLQVDSCLTFGHNIDATGEYKREEQRTSGSKTTKGATNDPRPLSASRRTQPGSRPSPG